MTVNYTTNLALGQPVTGTESGTWGDDVNNSVTSYLDIAISGSLALTSASFTANALTLANTFGSSSATNIGVTTAQYYVLKISSLAANVAITAPSVSKTYLVVNADASYSVTVKAASQTGISIAPGERATVYYNAATTDYIKVTSSVVSNLTGTLPVANGGTGVTTSTGTGNTVLSASPTFTGTPTLPTGTIGVTQSSLNSSTALATTAFVQAAFQILHPVGSIYINATNATNPGTLLGFGTWTAFGAGRVPVGFNAANALFDTAEETGGSADAITVSHTHTFTGTALATHQHSYNDTGVYAGGSGPGDAVVQNQGNNRLTTATSGGTPAGTISTTGSSETNANYQPYITVYMWKRAA